MSQYVSICTVQARNMVREVFRHRRDAIGLHSHEIWDTAHQLHPLVGEFEDEGVYGVHSLVRPPRKEWKLPPQPTNHPLRSMKYLKKVVLENMAERGEVEKVTIRLKHERDENGDHEQVLTSKKTGIETIPPEKRRLREELRPSIWLWRYTGNEKQLESEEEASPNAPATGNLRELFKESVDPDFGSKIKFIDVPEFPSTQWSSKKGRKYQPTP